MKAKTNIYRILILLIFLASCKQTQTASKGISKVTVAFSGIGCETKCPFHVLSIDKNLDLKYYGVAFTERIGYFTGRVSQETWDSIQIRFDKFIVNGIDTPKYGKTDHPDVEFFVHDGFRKHRTWFHQNTGKMTEKDLDILYWFMNIETRTNLITTDSLTFESTLQFPISPNVIKK